MSATIISQALADAILGLTISADIEIRAHDDDPGSGSDNEAPGLDPVVIASNEWEAIVNDTTTEARGGRVATNDLELEFSAAAGSDGSIAYFTVWHEDDPIGASGVFDVRERVIALDAPIPYNTGNRVYVPANDFEFFAAGAEE